MTNQNSVYVGTLNGKPMRFYPPQSDDDMMPWVATDDLVRAFGLPRNARRALNRASFKFRTVARPVHTECGAEEQLLGFHAVQGLVLGAIELGQITPDVHAAYIREVVAAAERSSPELFARRG
jgi:hypothetical protein